MGTALSAIKHSARLRFHSHDADSGILLFKIFCHACDGATCADTGHKDVDLSVGVAPYFRAGGGIMAGGIGRVFKLLQDYGARGCCRAALRRHVWHLPYHPCPV